MKTFFLRTLTLLAVCCFAISCSSGPEIIPEGLSPAELFQQAQIQSSQNRFEEALRYYQVFIDRYPDEEALLIEAEYEIAFIHYKQGDIDQAVEGFEALLEKYQGQNAPAYPQWPRVMAGKLLDRITEEE